MKPETLEDANKVKAVGYWCVIGHELLDLVSSDNIFSSTRIGWHTTLWQSKDYTLRKSEFPLFLDGSLHRGS